VKQPLQVLYVDDYPLDRELVRDSLEKEHAGFAVTQAASRKEFVARLAERTYDVVLSDFNILGFDGLQVLGAIREKDPDVPVIIVTGTGSEEVAVEAMKRGAADYVIKSPSHIRRLPVTIHGAIAKRRAMEEHRRAEESLAWEFQVKDAIAGLSSAIIDPATQRDVSAMVLRQAMRLTGSKLGCVGQVDPGTGHRIVASIDGEATERCAMGSGQETCKKFGGFLG